MSLLTAQAGQDESDDACGRGMLKRPLSSAVCLGFLFLLVVPSASAYSVLTHEAIIDSVWDNSIREVLLARFPKATSAELLQAHAYAYLEEYGQFLFR